MKRLFRRRTTLLIRSCIRNRNNYSFLIVKVKKWFCFLFQLRKPAYKAMSVSRKLFFLRKYKCK